jgi:hypothetical protein
MAIIDKPSDYFNTSAVWSGDDSEHTISGIGHQPDFTWIKGVNIGTQHYLFDSVRGATKIIIANGTNAEHTNAQTLKSWNSDGFVLGTSDDVNGSGRTYIAWNWKESATAGFDILTYEGSGSAQTISHNLGVKPDVIIVKNIDSSDPPFNWRVYHSSLGAGVALKLNGTDAIDDDPGYWNDTEPTSSVFSVKDSGETNNNNQTYIAYLFAGKQGYSKFGSYVGNGNADGTFVYTGFKPAWVVVKQSSAAGEGWYMWDNKRDVFNAATNFLTINTVAAQGAGVDMDMVSNGFKHRYSGAASNSAATYIYWAFAENPFVTSTGVPATAR